MWFTVDYLVSVGYWSCLLGLCFASVLWCVFCLFSFDFMLVIVLLLHLFCFPVCFVVVECCLRGISFVMGWFCVCGFICVVLFWLWFVIGLRCCLFWLWFCLV